MVPSKNTLTHAIHYIYIFFFEILLALNEKIMCMVPLLHLNTNCRSGYNESISCSIIFFMKACASILEWTDIALGLSYMVQLHLCLYKWTVEVSHYLRCPIIRGVPLSLVPYYCRNFGEFLPNVGAIILIYPKRDPVCTRWSSSWGLSDDSCDLIQWWGRSSSFSICLWGMASKASSDINDGWLRRELKCSTQQFRIADLFPLYVYLKCWVFGLIWIYLSVPLELPGDAVCFCPSCDLTIFNSTHGSC